MTTGAVSAGSERRRWTTVQKLKVVSESLAPHGSVLEVARRYGLNPNLIYRWRHQEKIGVLSRAREGQSRFALVAVAAESSARASMRSDHDGDRVIEVVLRNGRILRLKGPRRRGWFRWPMRWRRADHDPSAGGDTDLGCLWSDRYEKLCAAYKYAECLMDRENISVVFQYFDLSDSPVALSIILSFHSMLRLHREDTDMSIPGATWRRMDPGSLRAFVVEFADHLAALGHMDLTVGGYEHAARHFAEWLERSNIAIVDVDDKAVARFAAHRCKCTGNRRHRHVSVKYVRRVRRFVRFLAQRGVVKVSMPSSAKVVNMRVAEFQDFLRQHRGISERTIDRHGCMVMRLLSRLGDDPGAYDAELIRRAIVTEAGRSSRPYVKTMTTALRGYLRFLAANGACRPGLDRAVPAVPQWRLSALPRYLAAADVERLIASCDLSKTHGIRDKAILLLLARLGLRAGDVLGMRLDDVDWNEGTLRVRGKGRREVQLPLPQDAGDALLDYLEKVRPLVDYDRIFLRSSAPYRPFAAPCAISDVVRLALTRAGITDPPSRGANLLRHSTATAMLRGGATLDAIGSVLRHRSPDTTAHYAKVDIAMLLHIAQPWPGDVSC